MNVAVTAEPATSRHLPLGGTFNVRDLGGYAVAGGGTTRWRRVLRADALHRLDDAGREHLLEAGLKTVIDLRFDHEVASAPSPFRNGDGVGMIRLSLFDRLARRPEEFAAEGAGDPLYGLYVAALEDCRDMFRSAVSAIATAPDGMVLFHCTAGKDRTGLLAALLLLSVGVSAGTIEEDYALTAVFGRSMIATLLEDARARGDDVERLNRFMGAAAPTMRATLDHLAERYGTVRDYLAGETFDAAHIDSIRHRLVDAA